MSNKQLPGWLDKSHPDIVRRTQDHGFGSMIADKTRKVMMHLGTNDAWSNKGTDNITDELTTLVGQMRASKKTMKILVCSLGVTCLFKSGWEEGLGVLKREVRRLTLYRRPRSYR